MTISIYPKFRKILDKAHDIREELALLRESFRTRLMLMMAALETFAAKLEHVVEPTGEGVVAEGGAEEEDVAKGTTRRADDEDVVSV